MHDAFRQHFQLEQLTNKPADKSTPSTSPFRGEPGLMAAQWLFSPALEQNLWDNYM